MNAWGLRDAAQEDCGPLADLRAVVMRPDLERLGRYDEHRVRQRLRDAYDPSCTRIIEVDGALAGSVAVRPAEDGHWLEHFYLAPHLHGRGIGSAVLDTVLAECDEAGVPVRLNVLQGSPARRLYERHGFELVEENPVDVFLLREPAPVPSAQPGVAR